MRPIPAAGTRPRSRAAFHAEFGFQEALILPTFAIPVGDATLIDQGMACRPGLARELDSDVKSMRWHPPTVDLALLEIVQDAVLLFGDRVQRARLGRCENPGECRSMFYSDSRPSNACGAHRTTAVIACAPDCTVGVGALGNSGDVQLLREAYRPQHAPRFLQGVNPCERSERRRNVLPSSF